MFKLLLLVAAMPLVLVGSVRLAVRILRFVRAHRGEAIASLIVEDLRGWFTDALENWVEEPSSGHATSSSDGDHHLHHDDHHVHTAGHSDHGG
ncbi:MAG: hypothetical protein Q8N23_29740 [Archangium sp.]|nr:hypothetical protein [Archangium sp.]MDP3156890.1 hypothetical protein [Archangium sp.]MDP3575567.1 hypothetical protein [Archangium sp.]